MLMKAIDSTHALEEKTEKALRRAISAFADSWEG